MTEASQDAAPDFRQLLERALAPSYTVVRQLGEGGMGTVFLARDPALKRLVAVKVMAPWLANESAARARFEREAQAVASISHPNVVSVYSVGEMANGVPFLVMQYVDGESMQQRLEREGPLDSRATKRVIGEVASALAAAHRKGIVHRDIKPENILWDNDAGRALVTDFGVAVVTQTDAARDDVRLTQTGASMGTPAFMSPEQILAEPVTDKTDIYSLGLVGYQLLTRDWPYKISSPKEIMAAHVRDEPRPVATLRADVDPELDRLLQSCLAKDPTKRPTALELEAQLTHGLGVVLEWPPPGLEPLSARFRSASRILMLGGLGVGIPVVAVSAFERESLVRESLPSTPLMLAVTTLALGAFVLGCISVARFLYAARRAIRAGYPWSTVMEAAADTRGDTGAIITGSRHYATFSSDARMALRKNRMIAAGLRLLAGVTPMLGYVFAIVVMARTGGSNAIALWSSVILSITLMIAASLMTSYEEWRVAPAAHRLRESARQNDVGGELARSWTSSYERTAGARPAAARHDAPVVFGLVGGIVLIGVMGLMAIVVFALMVFSSGSSIISASAEPYAYRFLRNYPLILQRISDYRAPVDSSITPLRAGEALHAVSSSFSPGRPLRRWERALPTTTPDASRWRGYDKDKVPFVEDNNGIWTAAFDAARRGLSAPQRVYLRTIADHPALSEFRLAARARQADIDGALWAAPEDSNVTWPELPTLRFGPLRATAQSNLAAGVLALSEGRSTDAELRAREVISVGFLLARSNNGYDSVVGWTLVRIGRAALHALYQATGRTDAARYLSAKADPDVNPSTNVRERPPTDQLFASLRRQILDPSEPRSVRWELLLGPFEFLPCTDMHQIIFGPDSLHRVTLAAARRALARFPSEERRMRMPIQSVNQLLDPAASFTRRAADRPLWARIVSGVTGNRQLEKCAALLDLDMNP